ncbi:MAG TPA: hypothetical protein VD927_03345 [Chryseosolibacter sp.]|nr:hypothetical protein [Chryseosolibacter sp.]
MNTKSLLSKSFLYVSTFTIALAFSGCDDDEPMREDTPEMVTQIALTFSSAGEPLAFTATDPDGDGPEDIQIDAPILLQANTTYTLNIALINGLASPGEPGYDLTAEVEEEADEHIFFFGWEGGLFASPSGDGNLDNRDDSVNYEDEDSSGLPLGLTTTWLTGNGGTGAFRLVLKHQPGLKTSSSGSTTGETDVDITFQVTVSN